MPELLVRKCAGFVIAEIPEGIEGENQKPSTGAYALLDELEILADPELTQGFSSFYPELYKFLVRLREAIAFQ